MSVAPTSIKRAHKIQIKDKKKEKPTVKNEEIKVGESEVEIDESGKSNAVNILT